jgi:hypothetical protein
MGRSLISFRGISEGRRVRPPMARSRVFLAYIKLGVLLCALLDGAGVLLPLRLGTFARVDAGGLAAGDAHGGAGGGESCSAGEGAHFGYMSRRVRGC